MAQVVDYKDWRQFSRRQPTRKVDTMTNKTNAASKAANKPATVVQELALTDTQKDWKMRLFDAVSAYTQTGVHLRDVVLEARKLRIPEETVRALVKSAYLAVGCNKESARKRGADAVTLLNAQPAQLKELPAGLQGAAGAVRKLNGPGKPRAPRQPEGPAKAPESTGATNGDSGTAQPLHAIHEAIESLKLSTTDLGLLSILAEMSDLAGDLADRLALEGESQDVDAA